MVRLYRIWHALVNHFCLVLYFLQPDELHSNLFQGILILMKIGQFVFKFHQIVFTKHPKYKLSDSCPTKEINNCVTFENPKACLITVSENYSCKI